MRPFHLHLISDSTGGTLLTASRAVASQYENAQAIEHLHPMVRTRAKLDEVLADIDAKPGIVLSTIADAQLAEYLAARCARMEIPHVAMLDPIFDVFQSFLGSHATGRSGAQHALNSRYFRRIEAIDFTLTHDDGALPSDLEQADILLLGISRTSKTPTSIYLANYGLKIANIPLVLGVDLPPQLFTVKKPLVVALIATAHRISQVRENRPLGNNASARANYTDRATIADELTMTRKLCDKQGWPMIDVSRRSVEETAAEIFDLWQDRQTKKRD